jgi:pimeloyl-ACP methyl ester carboxylesterase
LHDDDPRVIAARNAEARFFDHYGLCTKTQFVHLEQYGLRVRCVECGEGAPIVIVPGNTGDGFPFIPLAARLARGDSSFIRGCRTEPCMAPPENYRLIIINRPGGGLSDGMNHGETDFRALAIDTITAVFDYYHLEKAPVIAHSMGGHWSLWFALERPERLSALVLPGVPGNVLDTAPPFVLRLASIPGLNRLLFRAITAKPETQALKSLEFMGHAPEKLKQLPEHLAKCYFYFERLPWHEISSLSLMETANGLFGAKKAAHISAEELRRIRTPVLLLWGENDPFGNIASGRRMAELLSRGEFRAMPGAGHLPWLDDPDFCAQRIREFLAGTAHQQPA